MSDFGMEGDIFTQCPPPPSPLPSLPSSSPQNRTEPDKWRCGVVIKKLAALVDGRNKAPLKTIADARIRLALDTYLQEWTFKALATSAIHAFLFLNRRQLF